MIEGPYARCTIGSYSLSTHASRDELIKLAVQVRAHQTILVHAASGARRVLAAGLMAQGLCCTIPLEGETFTFGLDNETGIENKDEGKLDP